MIILEKLSGEKIMINADCIELVTETPDTVVTTTTGHSYIVEDSMEDILEKVKEYKRGLSRSRLDR